MLTRISLHYSVIKMGNFIVNYVAIEQIIEIGEANYIFRIHCYY